MTKNKTCISLNCLDMEEGGYHLTLKIKVNGKTARMVLDTGASKTVFDKTRLTRLVGDGGLKRNAELSAGVGTNEMETHSVLMKRVAIGSLKITDYEAAVMDLSHVNQAYESIGMRPLDGVLGGDLLHKYKAIIDYERLEMKLFY